MSFGGGNGSGNGFLPRNGSSNGPTGGRTRMRVPNGATPWNTFVIALIGDESKKIPYAARMLVRLATAHAKPTRGAKLLRSDLVPRSGTPGSPTYSSPLGAFTNTWLWTPGRNTLTRLPSSR